MKRNGMPRMFAMFVPAVDEETRATTLFYLFGLVEKWLRRVTNGPREINKNKRQKKSSFSARGIHLIVIIVVIYNYVCECTVGVDVRDGTTSHLVSALSNIVMGCIVLGRQMNVDFGMISCINAKRLLKWMAVFVP